MFLAKSKKMSEPHQFDLILSSCKDAQGMDINSQLSGVGGSEFGCDGWSTQRGIVLRTLPSNFETSWSKTFNQKQRRASFPKAKNKWKQTRWTPTKPARKILGRLVAASWRFRLCYESQEHLLGGIKMRKRWTITHQKPSNTSCRCLEARHPKSPLHNTKKSRF